MPKTTVCPVAFISLPSAAQASSRALALVAGANVTLTPATVSNLTTLTIAASGGGGGTPASSVVATAVYGQTSVVGASTDYARGDHVHGSPALGTTGAQACAGNDARLSNSRAPTGGASGDLAGSYPGPTVTQARGLLETSGPTTLTIGVIADGQTLRRVGTAIVGAYVVAWVYSSGPIATLDAMPSPVQFIGSTWV